MLSMITVCPVPAVSFTSFLQPLMVQWQICLQLLTEGMLWQTVIFADNDLIAIGTIKALRLRGYKVPEQVAIVGFDNISEGRIIDPSLTSISIPRHYMGQVAARELLSQINEPRQHTCKIEVSANLVKRFSV